MWCQPSSPTGGFKSASRKFQQDVKNFPLDISICMAYFLFHDAQAPHFYYLKKKKKRRKAQAAVGIAWLNLGQLFEPLGPW